jgi:endoglucanase
MSQFNHDLLAQLLSAAGPSSFESRPAALWRKQAEAVGAKVTTDVYGNSFATFGSGKRPRVMLAGHIDEIGLMITYVDKEGYLYFRGIGGWDPVQLIGQRVRILGYRGDLVGVIGKKPIHLMTTEERNKALKIEDLWIDIGAQDDEDASQVVRTGDVAVIEQPYVQLRNGRVVSRAIDNRIGAYIVLEAARRAAKKAQAEVVAVATIQEEIGHIGAGVAAFGLEPDVAIAIDVTHATDQPGVSKKQHGDVPLGSGANISIGSIVHRGVFNQLLACAEKANIPHTIEAAPSRTATDGDDIAKALRGVPTAVVSVPTRYMHSPNEVIDLDDVEQVIRLLIAFIHSLDEATRFRQPD